MRFLMFLCVLLFGVAFAQDVQIRVLVAQQSKVQLVIPFSHHVMAFDGTVLYQSSTPVQWDLEVKGTRIWINGQKVFSRSEASKAATFTPLACTRSTSASGVPKCWMK